MKQNEAVAVHHVGFYSAIIDRLLHWRGVRHENI
jgi:hypothetical protein